MRVVERERVLERVLDGVDAGGNAVGTVAAVEGADGVVEGLDLPVGPALLRDPVEGAVGRELVAVETLVDGRLELALDPALVAVVARLRRLAHGVSVMYLCYQCYNILCYTVSIMYQCINNVSMYLHC